MNVACYHRFASASRFRIRRDTGWCAFCQGGRFDRPLLKCYKSTFCAALALRLLGASLVRFWVIADRRAAASSWWNVNNLLFGRAKGRLAEKVCRRRLSRQTIAL